ncbi:unnamed protein product (macronuclear) [Paramecium tetraurelia]|uniref:Uncharacterized protein n=1 Tax=Paramecium tetraurelia TaxID=5888 RepID=A0BAS8_PARTE|nr:uncharacterized protein GSPATT00000080001 [Paramecium tetraurelia]CAK55645.1 unnamed protein product [Paramecium tetraurelia]
MGNLDTYDEFSKWKIGSTLKIQQVQIRNTDLLNLSV